LSRNSRRAKEAPEPGDLLPQVIAFVEWRWSGVSESSCGVPPAGQPGGVSGRCRVRRGSNDALLHGTGNRAADRDPARQLTDGGKRSVTRDARELRRDKAVAATVIASADNLATGGW
jgi:hypothetical protein